MATEQAAPARSVRRGPPQGRAPPRGVQQQQVMMPVRPANLPPGAAPLPARIPIRPPPPRQAPFASVLGKVAAKVLSYPIERIRLGLQTQAFVYSEDDRFVDWTGGYYSAAASIIEAEGLLGLWAGLPATMLERVLSEFLGNALVPYLSFNLFSFQTLSKNFTAWLTNHLVKYTLSHILRHLILNPLAIAKVQITSDLGVEKNRRREKWRKEQETKKATEQEKKKEAKSKDSKTDEDEESEPKEQPVDPEEVKEIDAWWPLPLEAWKIIERVYHTDGIRGLLAGYPSTLAGAVLSRGLTLCLETFLRFLITAFDYTGPLPLIFFRMFGSSIIAYVTYPIATAAHVCMAEVGRTPKAQRTGGGSELWCNIHVLHTRDTWIQGAYSILAGFASFGAGAVFDFISRRSQQGRPSAPRRPPAPPRRRR